jgi:hypothetical protein
MYQLLLFRRCPAPGLLLFQLLDFEMVQDVLAAISQQPLQQPLIPFLGYGVLHIDELAGLIFGLAPVNIS